MTKQDFRKKVKFQYNEEFNGYTCPDGQWLPYSTTNCLGYHPSYLGKGLRNL